jgi:hypothetical protein
VVAVAATCRFWRKQSSTAVICYCWQLINGISSTGRLVGVLQQKQQQQQKQTGHCSCHGGVSWSVKCDPSQLAAPAVPLSPTPWRAQAAPAQLAARMAHQWLTSQEWPRAVVHWCQLLQVHCLC